MLSARGLPSRGGSANAGAAALLLRGAVRASSQAAPPTPAPPPAAAAAGRLPNVSEGELQRRVYNKEMHRLRKEFLRQAQRDQAAEQARERKLREEIDARKAARLEAKRERGVANQQLQQAEQARIQAEKAKVTKARAGNKAQHEDKLKQNRLKFLTLLRDTTRREITLANLEQRIDRAFFENPTPWKFEFVPFCAPDSPFWKQGAEPVLLERQVGLQRLQDMFMNVGQDPSRLRDEDVERLLDAGLLLNLKNREDLSKSAAREAPNSTVAEDTDEELFDDDFDEDEDEGGEGGEHDDQ